MGLKCRIAGYFPVLLRGIQLYPIWLADGAILSRSGRCTFQRPLETSLNGVSEDLNTISRVALLYCFGAPRPLAVPAHPQPLKYVGKRLVAQDLHCFGAIGNSRTC